MTKQKLIANIKRKARLYRDDLEFCRRTNSSLYDGGKAEHAMLWVVVVLEKLLEEATRTKGSRGIK